MDQDEIGDIPLDLDNAVCLQDENSQINISDVIEVIQTTDPTSARMFGNGEGSSQTGKSTNASHGRPNAYVKITEQPAPKALRFRYECEGRSAGSIPGVHSTPENKTFPSIQVVGFTGRAVVVVSCVTKDRPYKPHPHNLVGKDGCKQGVCTVNINEETMSVTFSNLGIQCVKKKDIEEALRVRQEIKVDPYKTGFSHRDQPSSIDLNSVRLCFQVFVQQDKNSSYVPLPPEVSDPIYDKKAMSDLVICKLSHCSCSVAGGQEMILLCEKVAKEDIQVRFYEEKDAQVVWEAYGDFQHTNVHKQVAISFRTPRYRTLEVDQIVKGFIQLKRPSDGATSDPLPFDYLPLDSVLKHKRPKIENRDMLYRRTQEHNLPRNSQPAPPRQDGNPSPGICMFPGTYRNPQTTPSPQPVSPATPSTPACPVPNTNPPFVHQSPHENYGIDFTGNYPGHFQNPGAFPPAQPPPFQQWNLLSSTKAPPPSQLNNFSHITPAPQGAEPVTQYNGDSATNLVSNLLMDMDSQQLTQLNSAELSGLSLSFLEGASAPEAALAVKQEAAARMQAEQENMTDSFTKLTTDTINEITNLGNMYNRTNN
ncbi:putative transcription factor p65 homolog isoform X2 [Lutzomyia longipalpis]|uniref:putative transcription factor p65 homolog isoform X2 n=1 Tax=Lutzomyia longipalpis TaxID=7200 RepID=UPI002484595B|nr:putative transcription factor p65 homolog isoform X2 [Lutzomyia longipalpis]